MGPADTIQCALAPFRSGLAARGVFQGAQSQCAGVPEVGSLRKHSRTYGQSHGSDGVLCLAMARATWGDGVQYSNGRGLAGDLEVDEGARDGDVQISPISDYKGQCAHQNVTKGERQVSNEAN